ncbi:MAG: zinc ribbon domain-containing protein [Syntrophales bacterium]|nr:zinc ribbon domain-containing protein [Syntrophales bacterium]
MPLYDYRCADCGAWDQRIGGLDDDTALCSQCDGIMIRVTLDIFQGYFAWETDQAKQAQGR